MEKGLLKDLSLYSVYNIAFFFNRINVQKIFSVLHFCQCNHCMKLIIMMDEFNSVGGSHVMIILGTLVLYKQNANAYFAQDGLDF